MIYVGLFMLIGYCGFVERFLYNFIVQNYYSVTI